MFSVAPIKVAAPVDPVVVSVKAFCFPLNVLQSVEDRAPRFVADAVGTFNVITGVVVPFATLLDKSEPVVPKVRAATLVTVPPEPLALIVSVSVVALVVNVTPEPATILSVSVADSATMSD
jgi:pentose-5-phosphate-3-epimerase